MSGLIGAPKARLDGVAKVTGTAAYAADRRLEGQLYIQAVRASVGAGLITALDVRPALAVPGVVAVHTHLDAAEALGWRPSEAVAALSAEALGRQALAEADPPPGYLPLAGPRVHFAGQWIALVVADTFEAARQASLLVVPEYERQAASVAVEPGTDDFLEPTFFFAANMQVRRGDWPTEDGGARVAATYRTAMQLHHPMEPSATVAVPEGDGFTVYDSTQGVIAARDYISASLGVPASRVRVVAAYVGGGFGGKNQMWPHQALAAHVARAHRRPARLALTRADMSVASGHRSATHQEVEMRATDAGRLTAVRQVSYVPTSMGGGFFEPCGLNTLALYDADALDVRHRVARKNIATPTPFRAPGETPGSFALECALDELAQELGLDPLEIRRRNFAARDPDHDRDWSSNNLLECYDLGARRFGWPAGPVVPRSRREGDELVGYGVATTAYPAPAVPATVRLRLRPDGPLLVETAATDIGTGMYTILGQVVADTLELPLDAIAVRLGDSDFPRAPTAGRSKTTASVLPAARRACLTLLDELRRLADGLPRAASNRAPARILVEAGLGELTVEGASSGMPTGEDVSFYSFGAHFVEVRVDEELGRLRVARVVTAVDCGRIVNPRTATSQIRGGVVFGIGMALMEAVEFHPTRARIVNDNLADYAIPVCADVPPIDVIFVEHPDERFNELGVRGLGEIGVPGVAAAVANALFHATGRRIRSLPITPARLVARGRSQVRP